MIPLASPFGGPRTQVLQCLSYVSTCPCCATTSFGIYTSPFTKLVNSFRQWPPLVVTDPLFPIHLIYVGIALVAGPPGSSVVKRKDQDGKSGSVAHGRWERSSWDDLSVYACLILGGGERTPQALYRTSKESTICTIPAVVGLS